MKLATIAKDKEAGAFIENDCTIIFGGKSFTSGGSWLCKRKDTGKFEGYVYAKPETKEVTSWDGTIRMPATFSQPQFHNFGGKQIQVWFTYQGMKFHGKYCCDYNECVHIKQNNS